MKTIINAVLSYGLINVPVGIATATKRKEFTFRTLHRECLTPIEAHKFCFKCAKYIGSAETEKGYEFAKNTFVVIDEDELNQVSSERDKVISLHKYVPFADVPELQVEKSYFLIPNSNVTIAEGYSLLSAAMDANGCVGIGHSSLWGKESPTMVWVTETGSLALSLLYCHDEVANDDAILKVLGKGVRPENQVLANEYVAMKMAALVPEEDLVSEARQRVNDFIQAKVSGLDYEIADPGEILTPTLDLQERLRASIEVSRA